MVYETKKFAIRSIFMLFLCAFFILGVEIYQRPNGEGLAKALSRLDGYAGGEYQNAAENFGKLYEIGAKEVWVYSGTGSREFAIAEFDEQAPEEAVTVFKDRLFELSSEYEQTPDELLNIEEAEIMLVNQYAVMLCYDGTEKAQKLVDRYFNLH